MAGYDFSAWEELPFVSCQCITFGRPAMLNEAVECFLRQDYPGPKELVILNDQPGVTYRFDHPEVRVINLDKRVETIGRKRNLCVEACRGQVILPWDDDDIHLPWRISVTIQEMKNKTYFKPKKFWVWTEKRFALETPGGGAPSMAGYSKAVWMQVDGYPEVQSGQDTELQKRLVAAGVVDVRDLSTTDNYYVYRWGTGHYHLSGYGRGQRGFETIGKRVGLKVRPGEYEIRPGWAVDYVAKVRDALA